MQQSIPQNCCTYLANVNTVGSDSLFTYHSCNFIYQKESCYLGLLKVSLLQPCGFSLATTPFMLCYVENSRPSNSIVVVAMVS